jgi:hypothetical protein
MLQVPNTIGGIAADCVVVRDGVIELSDIITAPVPRVQVHDAGGLAGASISTNIRGQNSVALGNQPLLYIDGVRGANSAGNGDIVGARVDLMTSC